VQSTPKHFDTEDAYTLGVQQGLIERAFLRDMARHNLRISRPWEFVDFHLQTSAGYQSPVMINLRDVLTKEEKLVRAKYLIGCDGGRSAVRNVMSRDYGIEMTGDWVDTLWGAIDAVVHTDFPDIRKIAAIHSRDHGAIMIFPRETNDQGKDVVRLYTQINKKDGPEKDLKGGVKLNAGDVKVEDIMEADRKVIFHPRWADGIFFTHTLSNSRRSSGGLHTQSANELLPNIPSMSEFLLLATRVIHIVRSRVKGSTPQ
jgi:2-polyprenyl-6-methoxyphenol hydroxylase-like FAD-dependent oxidoreductase